MQRIGMMTRLIAVALGVVIAVAALASASAQQEPPHRFYGWGTAGDTISAQDADGSEIGSATVAEDGSWYIDVASDSADGVTFAVNGENADAEITAQGASQSSVVLTVGMVDGDDDSLMGDDDDGAMEGDDDSLMGDDDGAMEGDDDGMMDDGDDSLDGDDVGLPSTGTGGLADNGGVSAGLIGLLIALGAAAVAGLGLRRVRNRA